ncbi:hypothetical protein [Halomonas organivorans]|uniref:Uncharacterized protein n=1 Tax=Halomonas organivorans TaxID=257772 RepID=A0A7W5BZY8_9GAMM|nr:hypothetical protein [Halomonas organivorans]MBB3142229.1 hypothetical protein [Halomonas organivorans]
MRTWKEWTTRQHAILDRDYPDGVPLDEIAQHTGHSIYAVKTRAAERGLVHPNRSSQACIARFERQHGKPLARIALWYRERRLPRTALAHDIGIEIKALRTAMGDELWQSWPRMTIGRIDAAKKRRKASNRQHEKRKSA